MHSDHELSALDRVRQAEAEVAGRIAGSREAAEQLVARTREQAEVLLVESQEAGKRRGQAEYRRLMLKAQDEARAICLESQHQVEALQRAENTYMDLAVRRVVAIITATEEEIP